MSAPALPIDAGKAAWSGNSSIFTPELRAVGEQLLSLDQAHLFAAWPAPGTNDDDKRRFLTQVAEVEHAYLGGVATYVSRAQSLLKSAAMGANPYEGFRVEAPGSDVAVRVDTPADFDKYEPLGMAQAANTAFVIVAGGLGERLGYKGIKLALPSDICTEVSYIELYARWILALQYRARIATNNPKLELQFAIMTSDDTDAMTRDLLAKNNNFGLTATQLTVFKQGKVPSLLDNAAHFVLDEHDKYALDTKPHGHGDVHSLLYGQGIVDRWVNVPEEAANDGARIPVKWIVFFQDTNGLVFHAIVPALGVSAEKSLHMNSITVPRAQGDAVGAICTLIREKPLDDKDLKEGDLPNKLTINVEYNQLEGLLGKGVKEPLQAGTNFSVYPGNINVLVMHAPDYLRVLHDKKGAIAEFVNPKYNPDRQSFKKPTRLESMMQDYPKLLDKSALVGFTQFDRGCSFSAVKNTLADGVEKQKSGNAPEVAATGEQDMYQYSSSILHSVGAKIQDGKESNYRGIKVRFPPRVIFAPSVGTTTSELRLKLAGKDLIEISERSTLLMDGENVIVGKLQLDGTLIIQAVPGAHVRIQDLSIRNAGWTFRELSPEEDSTVEQKYAIRGYVLQRAEQAFFSFDKPGEYVLSDATRAEFEQKEYKHPARRSEQ